MSTPPFVTPATLRGWLAEGRPVRLADVRWSLDGSEGRHTYLAGHLPGAVHVDLERDLSAPATPAGGRHPLPDPAAFAAALGRLGIAPEDLVVGYDQGSGAMAARLVWLCRRIGQPATVLAGGLAGWDGEVVDGEVVPTPVARTPVPWPPDRLADADTVARLATDPAAVVIDARDATRYRGEVEPVDTRPGHIPGAVNLPVAGNLGPDGQLLATPALTARYAAVGALDAAEVIAYCGSGVTACHDLLVLEALGVAGRLYPGSWSAWSADPQRPAALGPEPGGSEPGGSEPGGSEPGGSVAGPAGT